MSRWAAAFARHRALDTFDTFDTCARVQDADYASDASRVQVSQGVKGVTPAEGGGEGVECDPPEDWTPAVRAIRDARDPAPGTPEWTRLDRDQAAACAGLLAGYRRYAGGGR